MFFVGLNLIPPFYLRSKKDIVTKEDKFSSLLLTFLVENGYV